MGLRLLDGQISRYFPHALKADNRKAEVKQVLTPRRCNGGEKIILSFICDSRHMLPQQRPMKANQWWATCHRYASAPRFVRSLERIHQQIQASMIIPPIRKRTLCLDWFPSLLPRYLADR